MTKTKIAAIIIDSILILLTLVFIFGNSLQGTEKSSEMSESVTEMVEQLPPVQQAIKENKIQKGSLEGVIRSIAHSIEFAVLGAELMLLLLLVELKPLSLSVFLPFFLCLVLALADESLQMLNDRSAEVVDITKDFVGSIIGGLAVLGVFALTRRKKTSKKINKDNKISRQNSL